VHKIKKNIGWSLLGNILPLIVAVYFIPVLIKVYGVERFGLMTIAWSLVGYFGIFDMGFSRALTQVLSQRLVKNEQNNYVSEISNTTVQAMWLLGLVGSTLLFLIVPFLVQHVFHVSNVIFLETKKAFLILALCIPFVVNTMALKGIMDALELFRQSSIIRMCLGAGMFLMPYFASFFGVTLVYAFISLIILRIIIWAMHFIAVRKTQIIAKNETFNVRWLKLLSKLSGWIAVSNFIGPLMIYVDRFLIAHLLGATAIAFYVAPQEVLTKIWIIPMGFTTVLFPFFARDWLNKPTNTGLALEHGLSYVLIAITPIALLIAFFSHTWLEWWLGKNFSSNSSTLTVWLLAGVVANSMAQILFAYVQGTGRTDLSAKLHMLEAIPYWLLLWFLTKHYGINGAAVAWFFRSIVDYIGLAFLTYKLNKINISYILYPIKISLVLILIMLASILIDNNNYRNAIALVALPFAMIKIKQELQKLSFFSSIGQIVRKRNNKLIIDTVWPEQELEKVDSCPFCGSKEHKLAYENVKDWTFYTAPGSWTYVDCLDCHCLFLNTRPKKEYISKAYSNYYTHEKAAGDVINRFKLKLKNEIISKKYSVKLYPNLRLPDFFKYVLQFFYRYIYEPYGLPQLTLQATKGKIIDVGCGGGLVLSIAKQHGWDVIGLELDADAAKVANQKGLTVIHGSYEKLVDYPNYFDIIYCSHVLEHVYAPKEMLLSFKRALKPNGKLLLSLPNSQSFLRKIYGASWRGIEAPRHIAIPSQLELIHYLEEIGFKVEVERDIKSFTKAASQKIAKENAIPVRKLNFSSEFIDISNQDFCFITATA
jgi:O-antigen/teichoic acid export membrane protein/2-polyprenyl-3-methyl-5-hydroxy-6-metoxy-1,4-benzoquinol methylase